MTTSLNRSKQVWHGKASPTNRRNAHVFYDVDVEGAMSVAGAFSQTGAFAFPAAALVTQAYSSSGTGTVTPWDIQYTNTGVGASMDGAKFTTTTAVALGTYANAINGKLDFGSAGRVTGLGGVVCAELDLGAGTTQGSYACFEAELNCPSGGKTGTRTSFFTLNAWGADVTTIDTNAFLFDLNGVSAGASSLFSASGSIGNVDEITHGLKVQIGGATYYILLATAANFAD